MKLTLGVVAGAAILLAACASETSAQKHELGCAAGTAGRPNNALQPIVGAVTVGASSRPWALAPPSAERGRWADGSCL